MDNNQSIEELLQSLKKAINKNKGAEIVDLRNPISVDYNQSLLDMREQLSKMVNLLHATTITIEQMNKKIDDLTSGFETLRPKIDQTRLEISAVLTQANNFTQNVLTQDQLEVAIKKIIQNILINVQ